MGIKLMNIKQLLESTKSLTASEKALLAHCLISSLESVEDEGVEEAWGQLAEKRFRELESGKVKGVSWSQIKTEVKGL